MGRIGQNRDGLKRIDLGELENMNSLFCAEIKRTKEKEQYILKVIRRILHHGMD